MGRRRRRSSRRRRMKGWRKNKNVTMKSQTTMSRTGMVTSKAPIRWGAVGVAAGNNEAVATRGQSSDPTDPT